MTKEEFIKLFVIWNEAGYDLRQALMDWYNISYPKWNIYSLNPFYHLHPTMDEAVENDDLTDREFNYFLNEWEHSTDIPSPDEFKDLVELLDNGKFHYYECAHCGAEVKQGTPDNWDNFQGVCQDEGCGELCADCYCLYEQLERHVR